MVKRYPDGSRTIVATIGVLGASHGLRPKCDKTDRDPEQTAKENRERAQRRARAAVRDLALANRFEWFVTLTLDPQKIDRYDPKEVVRKAGQWLSNAVRRRGLKYVLVPEHHKDGAIHFHGFMSGDLGAVDSGRKDKGGHDVFNLTAWPYGFSTAIRPYGEHRAAVAYCCKYIAKQGDRIGGRWYYSGGDLERPEVEWCDIDPAAMVEMGAFEYKPKGAKPVWILDLPGGSEYHRTPDLTGLVEVGLLFGESQTPPPEWASGGFWHPQPDEWREQIRMEEIRK